MDYPSTDGIAEVGHIATRIREWEPVYPLEEGLQIQRDWLLSVLIGFRDDPKEAYFARNISQTLHALPEREGIVHDARRMA
jgi:hypothetical protein